MPLDGRIIEKIEYPESPALRDLLDQAREHAQEELTSAGVEVSSSDVNKSTYTYYHDWEREDPIYAFIVQNPGQLQRRHEMEGIREAQSPLDYVRTYQKYAVDWLIEKNAHFSREFFPMLDRNGLISLDDGDWNRYVREEFYDDFYLTDLVKYRVRTGDIDDEHRQAGLEEHLGPELRRLGPDVVFAFSSRVWNTFLENLNPTPLSNGAGLDSKVSRAHGYLYHIENPIDAYVVPLSHFSSRVYALLLRDSYFEYLADGLADLGKEADFHESC